MRRLAALVLVATTLAPVSALAGRVYDGDKLKLDLGGDVKGFFDVLFPYDHLIMPEDPVATAAVDFRFKFDGDYDDWLSWSFHHSTTATFRAPESTTFGLSAGTTATVAGEAFPLSWEAVDTPGFGLNGRVDRLSIAFHVPHVDIEIGRQPVSFGTGFFFTPMDLLSPYAPQVVDREYKPGVDALRVDGFIGATGRITAVAALVDDLTLDGLVVAGHGGFTVGVTDLNFFAAKVHSDAVVGVGTASSIGPVGVHGDLTVTIPLEEDTDEEPFVRVVVGADSRTGFGLAVMGELYFQSIGTKDAEDYDLVLSGDRFARGELWTAGHFYGALSISQEIIPIVHVSAFAIVNFLDPSALLGPSLSWSVAANADLAIGGFVALGKRPAELELVDLIGDDFQPLSEDEIYEVFEPRSELGLSPHQAYLQFKLYF